MGVHAREARQPADRRSEAASSASTQYGNPLNYAAACAIYKNVCKKYVSFQTANRNLPEVHKDDLDVEELFDFYAPGQMFWFDDVLCEAVEYGASGEAVYPDAQGKLFIRGKVLDVDPEGAHKDWPVGKVNGFPPTRCCGLLEGAEMRA